MSMTVVSVQRECSIAFCVHVKHRIDYMVCRHIDGNNECGMMWHVRRGREIILVRNVW